MTGVPGVELVNVSKQFGAQQVLINVSFAVKQGEALCLMGRSGTGKSVTLKLMVGLLKPDQGNVLIDTEDISRFREDDLARVRRKIGFLFQSAALFDSYTVGQNLAFPLLRLDKSRSSTEVDKAIEEALSQVGLAAAKNKMPSELSGGMKKRAGLARALILNPQILLVDEPSSGLDPITASEIDDLLLQVKHDRQTTMVIVTHDVHGAKRVGDKLAVLDKGALVGYGTAPDLAKSDNDTVRKLLGKLQS